MWKSSENLTGQKNARRAGQGLDGRIILEKSMHSESIDGGQPPMCVSASCGDVKSMDPDRLLSAPRIPLRQEPTRYFVYALYRAGDLTYIGSTTCLEARFRQHLERGRAFDSYSVVEAASEEEMLRLEVLSIVRFDPPENSSLLTSLKCGFYGSASMAKRAGIEARLVAGIAKRHGVETLTYRGRKYFNIAQFDRAVGGAA